MHLEDDLWMLEQQARRLAELRREIDAEWQDELARDLARRYLQPHSYHDATLRAALSELARALSAAEDGRGRVDELVRAADRLAGQARAALDEAQTETSAAWRAGDLHA